MELKSETISKISGALLEAQKAMGNAHKGSKNPFFRSSYADLNAIREVAIPALNSQGISVLQPTVHKEGKNFVRTLLLHLSGEFLASDTEVILAKQNDPQANGSGISYARRYGLQAFLNIGAVDDDGEAAMGRPSKQKENVSDEPISETTDKAAPRAKAASTKKDNVSSKRELIAQKARVLIAKKKTSKEALVSKLVADYGATSGETANDIANSIVDKNVDAVLEYLHNLERN